MENKDFEELLRHVEECAAEFKRIPHSETIRVISHLDCDGIASAAIITKALNRLNRKYAISVVQQLDERQIAALSREDYKNFIFTDIGSGQLSKISEALKGRRVFILDHHEVEHFKSEGVHHINPHMFNIDGSNNISGAGVTFLFARALDIKNEDLAHIAVIGAIGDVQEENGFSEINSFILGIAERKGKLMRKKGLRIFGVQSKPLHKLLEHSSDFVIKGVTGSESGAIQFLQNIGIKPTDSKGNWRKLSSLTEEEMQRLITAVIIARGDEQNPESIIGDNYILPEEKEGSVFRDAKEFSTLLNACGRMGRASFGIGACLGDIRAKQQALDTLSEYKKEITRALNWYEDNKSSAISGENFLIINAGGNVSPTIIGTLSSIISKSGEVKAGTIVIGMAQNYDGTTKVSMRIAGNGHAPNIDIRELLKRIVGKCEGETGGHRNAAGAVIPTEKEEEFISSAVSILNEMAIEERI
ncbi:MAG: DHH family phosphoesterase [Candidatus Woesearchaeota archaeon]